MLNVKSQIDIAVVDMHMTIVVKLHNAALNSSDNLSSYIPGSRHSSDDVYWSGGDMLLLELDRQTLSVQ